jgi:uncharacterized protein (DUF111 family)
LLAAAEACVHGVAPDAVEFHEVGAWDSIADIVGAATLIDAVGAARWTASAAPLGSGRVRTAHGWLPVPAPATTQLLLGLRTIDDGVPGERVTPTGAAILRYLCPPLTSPALRVCEDRMLIATGTGFGTRVLAGLSNHVRVLCFEPTESAAIDRRVDQRIDVLEFEVDDQSGEDLALGLDRLRAHRAVLDVTQCAVFGKKGRMSVHVQVLACEPQPAKAANTTDTADVADVADGGGVADIDSVIDACFRETTTLGVRHQTVRRIGLRRRFSTARVGHQSVRVKLAERPGGMTAKAEADDVAAHEIHARRAALRSQAELAALKSEAARSSQAELAALQSEAVSDAEAVADA